MQASDKIGKVKHIRAGSRGNSIIPRSVVVIALCGDRIGWDRMECDTIQHATEQNRTEQNRREENTTEPNCCSFDAMDGWIHSFILTDLLVLQYACLPASHRHRHRHRRLPKEGLSLLVVAFILGGSPRRVASCSLHPENPWKTILCMIHSRFVVSSFCFVLFCFVYLFVSSFVCLLSNILKVDDPDHVVDGLDQTVAQLNVVRRKDHRVVRFVVEESDLRLSEGSLEALRGTHGHTQQHLNVGVTPQRFGGDLAERQVGVYNVAERFDRG